LHRRDRQQRDIALHDRQHRNQDGKPNGFGFEQLDHHADMAPKVFQVPGLPAVTQTNPINPPAVGAEL